MQLSQVVLSEVPCAGVVKWVITCRSLLRKREFFNERTGAREEEVKKGERREEQIGSEEGEEKGEKSKAMQKDEIPLSHWR